MKEKQVTRTVKVNEVTVMGVDTALGEVVKYEFETTALDDKLVLEDANMKYKHSDTFKAVEVVNSDIKEVLFAMPESTFIALAEKLPPRKKTIEE